MYKYGIIFLEKHLFLKENSMSEKVRTFSEEVRGRLSRDFRPDWTIDLATGKSNSSPLYVKISGEIEKVLRETVASMLKGRRFKEAARYLLAQMVHVHQMAPEQAEIRKLVEESNGKLTGSFMWNGRAYHFTAEPFSS